MDKEIKVPVYLSAGKIISYALYAWVIFGIIVLLLRTFLLAFSANADTPFVNFVYNTSTTFLQPFRGIFPPKTVGYTGYLDVAALFAAIMYGLIGWGFSALIHYFQAKIDTFTVNAKVAAARKRQEQTAATSAPRKPAPRRV
jgi:uncharacterized protein YggT (Ycf19 family)